MDFHAATEFFDVGFNDVHADAAAGHVAHHGGRRKARSKDQLPRFGLGHFGGLFGRDDTFLDRLGFEFFGVETVAVVTDFDLHAARQMRSGNAHVAGGGFASCNACGGQLDAVVGGVANEVGERVGKPLEKGAVELDVIADGFELDFFAQLLAEVADDTVKFTK